MTTSFGFSAKDGFPWQIVTRVEFDSTRKFVEIHFRSGNSLTATAPTQEVFDELIKDATINLENHKIIYKN